MSIEDRVKKTMSEMAMSDDGIQFNERAKSFNPMCICITTNNAIEKALDQAFALYLANVAREQLDIDSKKHILDVAVGVRKNDTLNVYMFFKKESDLKDILALATFFSDILKALKALVELVNVELTSVGVKNIQEMLKGQKDGN